MDNEEKKVPQQILDESTAAVTPSKKTGKRVSRKSSVRIEGKIEKPRDFKKTLKRLTSYLKPQLPTLLIICVLVIISTVLGVLVPKVLGNAVTELSKLKGGTEAVDFAYIGKILGMCLGLYGLSAAFSFMYNFLTAKMSQTIVYNLRKEIHEKLDRLSLKYHDSKTHGEILSRVTNDVETINWTFQESLTQIVSGVVTLIGVFVMMLTINLWLTLIVVVSVPLLALVTMRIAAKSQKQFIEQQKELGEINGYIEEMYTGQSIVKLFNHEEAAKEEFSEINERLRKAGKKAQSISGIIMPALNLVNQTVYVAICVVGALLFGRGSIDLGSITAFITYSKRFSQPINDTAQIANIIQSTLAAAERVFEVLDEDEEVKNTEGCLEDVNTLAATVEFDNVDFSYSPETELIRDMTFTVKEGDTIAIVGPTGAGKTTLVNLLLRFYDVDDGSIKIDGVDIRNIERGRLRQMYGMVLQDTWLFSGTIRDNLAYGRPDATDEEIKEVCRSTHIDHFIDTLPDGYNTVLKDDATNISVGQRQLLTIARAILTEPRILILDEATSSVDTRTEKYIQDAMTAMMTNRTSFVIAHRLSTIKNAALILVMNKGRLIEQGTHKQLLAANGFYADLYNSQFTSHAD